jgi:hypothetical protein
MRMMSKAHFSSHSSSHPSHSSAHSGAFEKQSSFQLTRSKEKNENCEQSPLVLSKSYSFRPTEEAMLPKDQNFPNVKSLDLEEIVE